MKFLTKLFNIKKGEGKPFLLLFVHFFCFSAFGITAGSARDAFFLSLFEKTYLPLMFVVIAIVMAGVIPLYTRLTQGKDLTSVIMVSAAIFAATLIPFSYVLSGWMIPLFYVWEEIIIVLTITQFWFLAGEIFDARQSKRLFGLITGSGAISSILIGSSIRPFVEQFGSEKLLVAASFFILIISITSFFIKPYRVLIDTDKPQASKPDQEKGKPKFDKYLTSIMVIICSMAIVSKYVDYQFKITASNAFPTQDELVNFFGLFYALTGATAFIVQFFLTGRILSRFGVLVGLLILPLALFAGSIGFLLMPLLMTIYIPKFADQVFKFTINNATVQLLWLPIPIQTKKESKPIIDGTIKAFIEGFAGVSIFIIAVKFGVPIHYLSLFVLLVAGIWIYFTFKTKTGYVNALQKAIEKRQLNFDELKIDLADHAMVNTIEKALAVDDEVQQLFALELIEGIPLTPWKKTLNTLFNTGPTLVRKTILNMSADNSTIITDEELTSAIQDSDLAAVAIQAAGIRRLHDVAPDLEKYLYHENPELQITAAAALQQLKTTKFDDARQLLMNKMKSANPKNQALTIRYLSEQTDILTNKILIQFLETPADITSQSALDVAIKRKSNDLIPAIISNLSLPKTLPSTRNVLQQYPDDLVEESLLASAKSEKTGKNLLHGIIVILKGYYSDKTISVLLQLLNGKEKRVRGDVIDTLLALARQKPLSKETIHSINKEVKKTTKDTYKIIDFQYNVEQIDKHHILNEVIGHEFSKQLPFLVKQGIIDEANTPVESYLQTIQKNDKRQLPFVLEVLDNIFDQEEKLLITPLVGGLPLEELTKIGQKNYPELPLNIEEHLMNMIAGVKPWAAAVALDFALTYNYDSVLKKINWDNVKQSRAMNEIVQRKAEQNGIETFVIPLEKFNLESEDQTMYTTLEKTILLKTVDLFKTIPTEELSKVAQIAEEERISASVPLFAEGDYGDSLYIVVDGDIKIHKGERKIVTLGKGACLGEMALLDQEPRSADVTAETDSILLKITQEGFYEIMSSNMEIMQGIVKLLTGRLRDAIN